MSALLLFILMLHFLPSCQHYFCPYSRSTSYLHASLTSLHTHAPLLTFFLPYFCPYSRFTSYLASVHTHAPLTFFLPYFCPYSRFTSYLFLTLLLSILTLNFLCRSGRLSMWVWLTWADLWRQKDESCHEVVVFITANKQKMMVNKGYNIIKVRLQVMIRCDTWCCQAA